MVNILTKESRKLWRVPMNETKLSRIHQKMKPAFDEETINGFGHTTGFLERKRKVTSFSLATTLICLLAAQKVESLADLPRGSWHSAVRTSSTSRSTINWRRRVFLN